LSSIKRLPIGVLFLTGLIAALLLPSQCWPVKSNDIKQRLFERAFGDAAKFDPKIVAKVKKMKRGKRLYIDNNGDGKNDEVWYIDTAFRHQKKVKPLLVRVIDEDGDFDQSGGPDLDSDLYLADWNANGTVDVAIDYQDNDGDNDLDEMGMYLYKKRYRYLGNKSGLIVWWGQDTGDDNQLWYDINLTYQQNDCQYRSHFGGDEVFLQFGLVEGATEWRSMFENPFAFYDPDNDNCSEVVLRLSGIGKRMEALRYSFDIDDDAHGRRSFDYDFSITAVGEGLHLAKEANGQPVLLPGNLTAPITVRGIPTQKWLQREHAREFAINAPWNRTLLTWDEMNANTEERVDRDPHERWEGIINHATKNFDRVGGPHTSTLNKRNEISLNPALPLRLYYDPTDRRLHLKGANDGWLHVDFDLDGKIDAKYTYIDDNKDGCFDRRLVDVNGDGIIEFDWKMQSQRPKELELEFETLKSFYIPALKDVLEDSQRFIDTAKSALAAKTGSIPVDPVETFFQNKLESWQPKTHLGERMRKTPAGARLYVDLLRDRLLVELQKVYGKHKAWAKIESHYAQGNYRGAAIAISRRLPSSKAIVSKYFEDFNKRLCLRFNNRKGAQRDNWPISIPIIEIRAKAKDFNPDNCAVVAGERWIDWRRIPHQIDSIDPTIGQEISFLIDVRADEKTSYYLYYCPTGKTDREYKHKTCTAEDWLPPNIGWESNRGGYRAYGGQFDFFGKKIEKLIYPEIGKIKYHKETAWGMDALHVGETAGLGGLTLGMGGKSYRVYNPAGKGNVVFTKRQLVSGPVRAAIEISASKVIPGNPQATVRMLCIIYAQHQETEIRASVSGVDGEVFLSPGFTKLKHDDSFINPKAGYFGSWGRQDHVINDIGMGLIFPAQAYVDCPDLARQRQVTLRVKDNSIRYWLIGDWRLGRRCPVAPTIDNWNRELGELSELLKRDVEISISSPIYVSRKLISK
jgi:Domain of unknown function (DUF4861)